MNQQSRSQRAGWLGTMILSVMTKKKKSKWRNFFYKDHQWFLFGNVKINFLKKPPGVDMKKLVEGLDRGGVYKTGGFRVVETILKR